MMELFGRNFDLDQSIHDPVSPELAEAAAAPILMTEVEVSGLLDQTRKSAYDQGFLAGQAEAQAEAQACLEQSLAEVMTGILETLDGLTTRIFEHQSTVDRDVAELLHLVFERVFPSLLDAHGDEIVIRQILDSLDFSIGCSRIRIKVAPTICDTLRDRLSRARDKDTSALQIKIEPSDEMTAGAFDLQWENGRVHYDLEAACNQILATLNAAASDDIITKE